MLCAPSLVYSNGWTGQTSSISSTTIFTAPAAGLYRASTTGYVNGNQNGNADVYVNGTQILGVGLTAGANFNTSTAVVVELRASDVVTFSATIGGPFTGTFDVFAALEQLA